MHEHEINPFESPRPMVRNESDDEADLVRFPPAPNINATIKPAEEPIDFSRYAFWAYTRGPLALTILFAFITFVIILMNQANTGRLRPELFALVPLLSLPFLLVRFSQTHLRIEADSALFRWISPVCWRRLERVSSLKATPIFVCLEGVTPDNLLPAKNTMSDVGCLVIDGQRILLETALSSIEIPPGAVAGCDLEVVKQRLGNTKIGLVRLILQIDGRPRDLYIRTGFIRFLPWSLDYQHQETISLCSQILELCRQYHHSHPTDESIAATIPHSGAEQS